MIRIGFWAGSKYNLSRMTMRDLVRAYFTHYAVVAYFALAAVGLALAMAWMPAWTAADIARVNAIWRECRQRWGKTDGGPFLFGHWTIADAMYAPVVTRFRTYGVRLDDIGNAYMDAALADPDFLEWEAQAMRDPPPEPRPG